jgi:hypothetical protein
MSNTAKVERPLKECVGVELVDGTLRYRGMPVEQMMAYPISLAARLCGMCYDTMREKIDRGHVGLVPGTKLVSRESLERFLRGETGKGKSK